MPDGNRTWPVRFGAAEALFALSLLVYAASRLYRLADYPIYFFCDEAIHATLAESLLNNGLSDQYGALLPTYFKNGQVWNLGLSVYVHVLPVALFGKSIAVTRATSALVSVLGVASIALILKLVYRQRFWWLGVLVMGVMPAWFLHSRTAFETVMMTSFFAAFLLCYLLYRTRSPDYVYAAVLLGGATFYAYSNGQAVIGLTALLLAISDWNYHRQVLSERRRLTLTAILVVAMALPYVRFRVMQPEALPDLLYTVDSYLVKDLPATEKVTRFAREYAHGLSPRYWFTTTGEDLVRHRMSGAHIPLVYLPFMLIGLGICLWRWRLPEHRAVLIAALAAPFGAAAANIAVTRAMAFLVPTALLVTLGMGWALELFGKRVRTRALTPAAFALLALAQTVQLGDALRNGPLWHTNYGLYGMQYGARQVFDAISEYRADPDTSHVILSQTWANNVAVLIGYFLVEDEWRRVHLDRIERYTVEHDERFSNNGQTMIFVMTPNEYEATRASGKFDPIEVDRTMHFPDGEPGMYFVRMAYVDDIVRIMDAERAERMKPVTGTLPVGGRTITVQHSLIDRGRLQDIMDADLHTHVRVLEANPALVDMTLDAPGRITGVEAILAQMDLRLTVEVFPDDGSEPVVYTRLDKPPPPDPSDRRPPRTQVTVPFDRGPDIVSRVRMEIHDTVSERAKIHIYDIVLHEDKPRERLVAGHWPAWDRHCGHVQRGLNVGTAEFLQRRPR